jgi:integrase
LDGVEIPAFSHYCKKILGLATSSHKRYAEVVAHLIEYLIVAKVLGFSASRRHINAVLDAYPRILQLGSVSLLRHVQAAKNPDDAWLIPVLGDLEIEPIADASFSNTLAPINNFLTLSENLAFEAFEKASIMGLNHGEDYRTLFDLLEDHPRLSAIEVQNMRSNSMLGSVIRFRSQGIVRPRGTSSHRRVTDLEAESKAFPFEEVMALANAATSYRDRAFWLGLAASGLRTSEVKALTWDRLNINTQEVFVMDPRGLRFGKDVKREDVLRFKGRATSFTYLIYQFKVAFFEALALYVRHEYVPQKGLGPHYIFQYVDTARRGQPFIDASDAAILKNFQSCCERARISPRLNGGSWAPHSLRHMYAVYMHNDLPLEDGTFGLSLAEVSALIGHASVISTAIYARKKRDLLRSKIQSADQILMADTVDVPPLSSIQKYD